MSTLTPIHNQKGALQNLRRLMTWSAQHGSTQCFLLMMNPNAARFPFNDLYPENAKNEICENFPISTCLVALNIKSLSITSWLAFVVHKRAPTEHSHHSMWSFFTKNKRRDCTRSKGGLEEVGRELIVSHCWWICGRFSWTLVHDIQDPSYPSRNRSLTT